MDSPLALAEILGRILNYTASINPSLRENLQDGLSLQQIEEKTSHFALRLPREVEELYQWRNGMKVVDLDPLLYYHRFLSLDEALELHQTWQENNFLIQNSGFLLIPLFEFEGEYYATCCSGEEQDTAPIYFIHHDRQQVYDSLKAMLLAILECYDTGAYQPRLAEDGGIVIDNKRRIADIKLHYNPGRIEMYQYADRLGKPYYHP